jgi:hypothetical protein
MELGAVCLAACWGAWCHRTHQFGRRISVAVILGVPTPIALMVGYCTLVGAVYLAMAPLAYRALAQSPSNQTASHSKTAPDYKAWSLVKVLSLGDAAYLWCDRDPHVTADAPEVETWMNVFKEPSKAKS